MKRTRDFGLRSAVAQAVKAGQRDTSGRWQVSRPAVFTVGRATHIQERRVGWEVRVHNGRSLVPVKVLGERVGHRFGEFAATKAWYRKGPVKTSNQKPKAQGKVKSTKK